MNNSEGITLAKMAVIITLVVLVLGAIFTLWYKLSKPISDLERNMEKAANSTSSDRLYDLCDMTRTAMYDSDYNAYPLVTNVCSALTEFNEDDLMFIYTVETAVTAYGNTDSNPHCYTYKDVTVELPNTLPGYIDNLENSCPDTLQPVSYAVQDLLTHSGKRCAVEIVEYTQDSNTFIGIVVRVLNKEV